MKFNLSTNISQGVSDNFNYIVTPNAQKVYGNIVDSFQSGIHSFLIIIGQKGMKNNLKMERNRAKQKLVVQFFF